MAQMRGQLPFYWLQICRPPSAGLLGRWSTIKEIIEASLPSVFALVRSRDW